MNSEVELINDEAFIGSTLKGIEIPSRVKRICQNAFDECKYLVCVSFAKNSKIEVIYLNVWMYLRLQIVPSGFLVPSSVTNICDNCFFCCSKLKDVSFHEDSELRTIEKEIFSGSSIDRFEIPSKIYNLDSGWPIGFTNINMPRVSSKSQNFTYYYNKTLILGKSDQKVTHLTLLCLQERI